MWLEKRCLWILRNSQTASRSSSLKFARRARSLLQRMRVPWVTIKGLGVLSIEEGLWREECHFRAGEELGRSGRVERAFSHCVRAGRFAKKCLTQAAWYMPPDRSVDPLAENALSEILSLEKRTRNALSEAPQGVSSEGVDVILSRAWFNLYYGTGLSNPAVAKKAPGEHAAHARTAFALEAVRLIAPWDRPAPANTVEQVVAIWKGRKKPIKGEPLGERRLGRFVTAVLPDDVRDVHHVTTFGGGRRMVAERPEDDVVIAALEALFFEKAPVRRFSRPTLPTPEIGFVDCGKLLPWAGQGNDAVNAILEGDDPVLATFCVVCDCEQSAGAWGCWRMKVFVSRRILPEGSMYSTAASSLRARLRHGAATGDAGRSSIGLRWTAVHAQRSH